MIWIIAYLAGYIFCYLFLRYKFRDSLTGWAEDDKGIALLMSVFSWLSLLCVLVAVVFTENDKQ